ncbi:33 kDa inner dynein arm light chain, axonemal [Folsomia candida]|nr:33 kDa inner dynein arm light chain, axonemal [Folsomia candida]
MQHACKEAALSQIDKDQILEAIVSPREWEEDGKRYKQLISKEPATRADVSGLNELLNEQLTLRQARPDGICLIRRELAEQCFDELIRQVTLSEAERGLLLLRVRDELRMTLSAYQDLFVSARDHDPRKTVGKEIMAMKQEYTAKYDEFASAVSRLEKEKQDLIRTFENNDQISKEERESSNKRHHEEFQFLKRINNTLKQQIDAMIDPENDIDPVIAAYESIPIKQTRGIWKYTKICKEGEATAT